MAGYAVCRGGNFVVKQGDIIAIDLDPIKGHEQAGYRPALVINNAMHSKNSSLTLICPITNKNRQNIMHVKLTKTSTTGYVLCDQVRAVDLSDRKFKTLETLDFDTLWDVCDIVKGAVDILQPIS
jgi:mRNA interferase MazF